MTFDKREFMVLWQTLWHLLLRLRPSFSRTRTFLWFSVVVAGFCARRDPAGVTSFVRALGLKDACYDRMLDFFHSGGIKLEKLTALWTTVVLQNMPICRVNGRLLLVADGIKVPKEGKQMPSVKCLHQESQSNSKPEYIMGHSCQALAVLVASGCHITAVPLISRICEGIVLSNRSTRTLLDKLLGMVHALHLEQPFYLIADAYYASRGMVRDLLRSGNHLVTRARTNSVAYAQPQQAKVKRRGRKRLYGDKIKLRTRFQDTTTFVECRSPIYDEQNVILRYLVLDLVWRPVGHLMRFVLVVHPTRGNIILMSSDLTLSAVDVIKLYAWRFKIEVSFKQAVRSLGAYAYHFWSMYMRPIRRGSGNQYLHKTLVLHRAHILRKIAAYHAYIQTGIIAQGLLLYLAVTKTALVWKSFGSWLRTIRPGILPTEQVVMLALRNSLPDFLADSHEPSILQKFIRHNIDLERAEGAALVA